MIVFIEKPFFKVNNSKRANIEIFLLDFFKKCSELNIIYIVIPLVDNSSILHNTRKYKQVVSFFKSFFYQTNIEKVNLCLETDLPPKKFLELVNEINLLIK